MRWFQNRERPTRRSAVSLVAIAATVMLLVNSPVAAQTASSADRWVGTWATAEVGRPQLPPPAPPPAPAAATPGQPPPAPAAPAPFLHFNNQTLRQIVRTSIGGSRVRIAIANTFGTAPLTIGAAHIALRAKESALAPESDRALTFSGRPTITIPSGAVVYSDSVNLTVPALADVAVDLYLPGNTNTASPVTMHNGARQTSYISQTGNHVGVSALPVVATTQSWFFLTRVEVIAPEQAGAIVAFGDSITDGAASTMDANRRWPNRLAERLMAQPAGARMAVLNAGIGGNRVLSEGNFNAGVNALARFERDALGQNGVTHIIVLEGINDISNARQNPTPTAEDIIAIHKQMIDRAHAKGVRIIGATLTPNEGCGCFTSEGEAKRQAINQWIRTGGAYDGVIDFEAITRDPAQPARFLPTFDSGDHLHPNDAGYQAMGDGIDLTLFRPAPAAQRVATGR
jgi:lysophospholipase L1-like esterase